MKVGIFDSGLGGLTVVRAIADIFNGAELFYVADTAYAPYGTKTPQEILNRCERITQYLDDKHEINVLIVACNTATSAAIVHLRKKFPSLILIGLEPGIKPAMSVSQSSKIGVLATPATLNGQKYQLLANSLCKDNNVQIFEQACPGLVEQIEKGEIIEPKTVSMIEQWLSPMIKNSVDTIVLGCTHYPLIEPIIKDIMGKSTHIIHTGLAVAKHLKKLSEEQGHTNEGELNIRLLHTADLNVNMVNMIFKNSEQEEKIIIRKCVI